MTATTVALLAAIALLLAVVLFLWRRGGPGPLQQQLIELRARLDALVQAQQDVPRSLAEGSAIQARSLADLREQLGSVAEATRQMQGIGEQVSELQALLSVPKLRGGLGEIWLEEALRQVFPAGRYEMQYTFRSGDVVDAVLRVGERLVAIDSKFPLEDFRRIRAGEDEERARRAFRRSLKARIDEIADRYIRPAEGTYDFALMYVPAEGVYYEAVVRDGEVEGQSATAYALERRVIPVSPNTLYAYLAVVLHGLRGLEVQERATEILDGLAELQRDFGRFERTHQLVGRHLTNAERQYDESLRQLGVLRARFASLTGVSDGIEAAVGAPDEGDAAP